ncbi:MAG: VacB/RNase II family 3'-5' exoribonuclease [Polyangiaceae bacterium]|nr:VacB/RNase II family 3'-5' exoribonuclease [Polyangiaceae bacterium]
MNSTVRGRISIHPRGFGFVTADGNEPQSAFVAPPDLNAFLDGDIVSAKWVVADDGRVSAQQLTLIERPRKELFGTVTYRQKKPFLRVDRLVANTDWPLESSNPSLFIEGAAWVATIQGTTAVAVRPVTESDLAIERCVARHGIRSVFSTDVLSAAETAAKKPTIGLRRDLRSVPTVTIDGPSTRDIDDALSAYPADPDGALRVLVSIADVDAFVPEGSVIDQEARLRGTSVYLAGRVVPMLPHVLSSDAASLVPDQDRLALTVEMRIDPEGKVTSVDLYESLIRSHARLDYDSVSEFFAEGHSTTIAESVIPTLRWLRTAAARISATRAARGGVDLAREEAYIELDSETGEPTTIFARQETESHRLVERLMVAANEAVAEWLTNRGLPGMFRVHDAPAPERTARLAALAQNFGLEPGFGPTLTPRGLSAFEAQFRTAKFAPALRTVLGKTLGPARYTVIPSQHFGLGAPLYLHFTSPIRRYADLVVHRIIKRYLNGDRTQIAGDATIQTLAERINHLGYIASKAEAERHRMLVARLLSNRIGERVRGNVITIKPFGLVIQMAGTGATGTIANDSLPNGPYQLDPSHSALVGSTHRFAIGDAVECTIASTNEDLGRIDLTLILP